MLNPSESVETKIDLAIAELADSDLLNAVEHVNSYVNTEY
jgi:hypothetical protein